MTRFERLKQLDINDMAWLFVGVEKCDLCDFFENKNCDNKCKRHIKEWLKKEVSDEDKVQQD